MNKQELLKELIEKNDFIYEYLKFKLKNKDLSDQEKYEIIKCLNLDELLFNIIPLDELSCVIMRNFYINDIFEEELIKSYISDNYVVTDIFHDVDIIESCKLLDLNIDDIFSEIDIKDFVNSNYQIDDVYSDDEIIKYSNKRFNINEIYEDNEILEYVKNNFSPEEVFGKKEEE